MKGQSPPEPRPLHEILKYQFPIVVVAQIIEKFRSIINKPPHRPSNPLMLSHILENLQTSLMHRHKDRIEQRYRRQLRSISRCKTHIL